LAQPGEFTLRAYKHGRFDLAQAEAVADLIHAETEAAQRMAFSQMRGGFSKRLSALREKLIHFASLIELELDFGEEDVEFANRQDLKDLLGSLLADIGGLISSFSTGNALKNGVPVVIAGRPNAGKSTLLNALLQEERALVSDIPGTTRDTVEDTIVLGGLQFRFIDTAGLRETTDVVEAMGVSRTRQKMQDAQVILYMLDLRTTDYGALIAEAQAALVPLLAEGKQVILVGNKVDDVSSAVLALYQQAFPDLVLISALNNLGLNVLTAKLISTVQLHLPSETDVVVSNLRHVEALRLAEAALERALTGLHNGLTGDFLALDIRHGLYHLGEITGEITTDDLLGNIFSRFCIGK
jgi:tRNA modification GTPase